MKTQIQRAIASVLFLSLVFLVNVNAGSLLDPPTGKVIGKVKLAGANGQVSSKPELLVSAKGGIQNVVITIEGIEGPFKADPIEISQESKTYIPRISVSMVGNDLTFLNHDAMLHNVHGYSGEKTLYNFAMPKFLKKKVTKLDEAGLRRVRCDVHQEMIAYVVVAENPFYAITNEAGLFQIDSLPAGTYKIKAWHETLGESEQTVTITQGKKTAVIFELKSQE